MRQHKPLHSKDALMHIGKQERTNALKHIDTYKNISLISNLFIYFALKMNNGTTIF